MSEKISLDSSADKYQIVCCISFFLANFATTTTNRCK